MAVTSVYQKLNNLPQSQIFHSLGAGILAHGATCRFLGGSTVLNFLCVFVKLPLFVPFRYVLPGSQSSAWFLQGFGPQSHNVS